MTLKCMKEAFLRLFGFFPRTEDAGQSIYLPCELNLFMDHGACGRSALPGTSWMKPHLFTDFSHCRCLLYYEFEYCSFRTLVEAISMFNSMGS